MLLFFVPLCLCVRSSSLAQSQPVPANPKSKRPEGARNPASLQFAIVGGDVWTVTNGVIRGGTVLVKDGKIEQVGGPDLKPPANATIVDAHGLAVVPGFIVASSRVTAPPLPGGKFKDLLDPFALAVELAAASGVTTTYLSGADAGLGTSNAVIKMTRGDLEGMVAVEGGSSSFGGGGRFSRSGGLSARWTFRDQLRRGKEYLDKLAAFEADKKAGKKTPEPKKPADAEAVLPLLKKERPVRFTATTVGEIRWALSLADEFGIREVISPATEAWIIADEIAKRNALLVITPRDRDEPDERRNAPSGANPDAAGILQKAGVKFAVVPIDDSFSVGGERAATCSTIRSKRPSRCGAARTRRPRWSHHAYSGEVPGPGGATRQPGAGQRRGYPS